MGAPGMRVAMLCPYAMDRPGGVQGQVAGLAGALRARGVDVTVLAPLAGSPKRRSGSPWRGDGARDGRDLPERMIAIGRSIPVPANGSRAPVALSPSAFGRARRILEMGGFDVVHVHEPLAPVIGWAALAQRAAPVVATFHRSGSGVGYRLAATCARRAVSRVRIWVAVSSAAAQTVEEVFGRTPDVLWNGVDVERFSGAGESRELSMRLVGPRTGNPSAVFIGRHEPRKGLDTLLRAWEILLSDRDRDPVLAGSGEPVLWVAGEGEGVLGGGRRAGVVDSRPVVDSLPGVRFLGRLTDAEVAAVLRRADVLCAPSLGGESFGVVLLEGIAAGCLVVASDIPGYREALAGHGILVPPGDPGQLAVRLAEAFQSLHAGTGAASAEARARAMGYVQGRDFAGLASEYLLRYRAASAA